MTPAPSPPRPPAPLLSLQVLRAVAALLVVLHHAAHDADTIAARTGAALLAPDRFVDLAFGVHLFFVVSGFIMLRTARGFGSGTGARLFLARRVVRVVPLYWLMTSLVLAGAALAPSLLDTPPGGLAWVLGSYLFVPVARPGGGVNPALGQGWTLDYEMFFYGLFGTAMLFPRRAALPGLAAALLAFVALGRLWTPTAAAPAAWTDGLLLEFLFGLAVGAAAERGLRLGGAAACAVVLLGAGLLVAMGPLTGRFDGVAPSVREGVPAAIVVGGCVLGPRWRAGAATVALALVGDASYSLYLSHPFAVRLLRQAWLAGMPAEAPPTLYLALACAAAVGVALALHRWVERPMTEALGRRLAPAGASSRPILPEAAAAAEAPRRS